MRCTPAFAEKSGYTGLVKLEVLVLARPKDQACMSQKTCFTNPVLCWQSSWCNPNTCRLVPLQCTSVVQQQNSKHWPQAPGPDFQSFCWHSKLQYALTCTAITVAICLQGSEEILPALQ